MKKILYNNKIKKILVSLIIFIMISSFAFPSVVRAAVSWSGNNATGSIQEVADSMRTRSTSAETGSNQKTIADMVGTNQTDKLERAVTNEIKNKFPDLEEGWEQKVYNYYANERDMIEVTCKIIGGAYNGYTISGFTVNFGETLTLDKIKEDLNGKSDEEIGKVDTGDKYTPAPSSSAVGQDPSGGPTVDVDEDTAKSYANLGGVLLKPVVSLINFVADAVISITGYIMMPDKVSFGQHVLVSSKDDLPQYTNTYTKEVDTSSFLWDFGNAIGTLINGGDSSKYAFPNLPYTPEEIFAGKIDLLSIDFISGKNYEGEENQDEGWGSVREVISQWYQILRMIAIIGLLSVLIYTGIKIIISSNAKDKAKYKEWIVNWFMAVAILFAMHYIMAFIISITGEFSKLLAEACQGIHVVPSDNSDNAFDTNLMGLVRFMIQSENLIIVVGYEVMYIALIFYTLKFTMIYLKRVLNMAFLTLIAPIVALTYPIDKINDGRAQGFDMWLKEYIFNALLQPMHQVLYYVLVGSAVSLAASNPLYGIVVLAFMTQAEKLLKKIFGFDKAGGGTVGGMTTAFAAGAVASNLARLAKLPKGNAGKGGAGIPGGSGAENIPLNDLRATDKDQDKDNSLFTGSNRESTEPTGGPSAADAYQNSSDPVADAEREALEEKIAEGELNESELTEEQKALLGRNGQDNSNNGEQQENGAQQETAGNQTGNRSPDRETPIHQMSKGKKFAKGMGNVGKRLLKPVWDTDHGAKYNGLRLARKIGRAAVGASIGIGAAAVQAGISITDGKYNPMEGIAAFTAGYAGGGQVAKGFRSLGDTFMEGTLPDNPEARKEEQMQRVLKSFSERDDVIKHNKNKYASGDRKDVVEIQKKLLQQGVTDLNEMDDCIKYIKATNNGKLEGYSDDSVRKARALHDFSNDANVQKVRFKEKDRTEYINTVAKNENEKKAYENKFKELIEYDRIVKQK